MSAEAERVGAALWELMGGDPDRWSTTEQRAEYLTAADTFIERREYMATHPGVSDDFDDLRTMMERYRPEGEGKS